MLGITLIKLRMNLLMYNGCMLKKLINKSSMIIFLILATIYTNMNSLYIIGKIIIS